MADIVIKDLPESIELDREAMSHIYGGSRSPLTLKLSHQRKLRKTESSLFFGEKRQRR